MLPTWTYTTSADSLYVNLFVGSKVTLPNVAGAPLEIVQTTDYPWSGKVALTVNPSAAKAFDLKIRVPNRSVSELYTSTPDSDGITLLAVNGARVKPVIKQGYAVISRKWKAGDTVEVTLPMLPQRIKADSHIAATRGRAALRYGPLIYNIESVDQNVDAVLSPNSALATEWKGDLLGGVMVIKGTFADGSALTAIPNYARLNRGGRSIVWVKDQ
jgi:DUF1680 family protein